MLWIIEKASEFPKKKKKNYVCFTDYDKVFDYVDHNKLKNILNEMGISDHFTCFLRNLYEGQEATVRNGHGKNGLVPNQERRLYIAKDIYCHPAYLINMQSLIFSVHYVKSWAG